MNPINTSINKVINNVTSSPISPLISLPINTEKTGRFLLKTLVITMLVGSLSACSALNFGKSKKVNTLKKEPTELIKLLNNRQIIQPVLKVNSGSIALNKKTSLKLEPSFDGQHIFTVSASGKMKATSISGRKLWSVNLDTDITGGVTVDKTSKTAVVSTKAGKVIALNSETGEYKWIQQLSGSVLTPALISKNRVLLSANNGILHGLSLQTGQSVWQYSTQVPNISVYGMAKPIPLDQNTVLFSTANGRIYAIDTVRGKLKWSRRVGIGIGSSDVHRMSDIDGTPIVDERGVYAVSYSGQLVHADSSDGSVKFVKNVKSVQQPAVTAKSVVVAGLNGKIMAFDKMTGEKQWENADLLYRELSNPVALKNTNYIAIGDLDGVIHVIDKASGRIVSREKTSGAVTSLQVLGRQIVSQTKSGKVEIWQF